jgi:TetR/AcrR family transcriptional regulator, transcriptional repressor for nem operon
MRHKEFNRNKILEDCIALFWTQSYSGTSISDVVKATNVNRYSLYNEFKNKRGILDAAIQLYLERYSRKYFSIVDTGDDLKSSLYNFYNAFIVDRSNHPPGCFILYIGTELADNDEGIQVLLKEYLKEIRINLKTILEKHSVFQDGQDIVSGNLIGLFCGLMTVGYIQTYSERVDQVNLKLDVILK